ncbi:glycosyltransferase family 32 protein [Collinsella sp. LCP19S3_B11]|uniref:glycosyltransferase family 32 protein n=1 Tax=Collinsella sp. LCP19S3_B11 TaxID=3438754 RepID=UPI003F91C0DF
MIPKIIHYCWFGGVPLGEKERACIESWKKFCPDYEIKRWDETNYDVRKNKYMSDAYDHKKWAFVSDYARVDVVNQFGGLYFDTDVELVRSPDELLDCGLFCGWENRNGMADNNVAFDNSVAFGLGFGAIASHPVLIEILNLYETLDFVREDGTLNLLACPAYQTDVLRRHGLDVSSATRQSFEDIEVYPEDWFSPQSQLTGETVLTPNTVSIHHFSMTWMEPAVRRELDMEWKLISKLGYRAGHFFARCLTVPTRLMRKICTLFQ